MPMPTKEGYVEVPGGKIWYEVVGGGEGLPLGETSLIREGRDLTIVATSWMVVEALRAAEILARNGVECEIINARSIAPFDDTSILTSCERTGHCIVADNDWLHCGFSGEVAARVMEKCFGRLKKPVTRIGWEAVPCPTTRPLENRFYPNAIDIIEAARAQLELAPIDLSGETFYDHEHRFKGPF